MELLPQNAWLEALGWALVNSWWQFGILWFVWLLLQKLWPQPSSSFRFNLALGLLLTGTAWVFATGFLHYAEAVNSGNGSSSPVSPAGLELTNTGLEGWWTFFQSLLHAIIPYLSITYLGWLLLRSVRMGYQYRNIQLQSVNGLKKIPTTWRLFVASMSDQMNIGKNVQIWLSEKIDCPQIIGWFKPVILLPVAALNQLSTPQLEAILIHELAHIRRNDYLWNWVVIITENLLFFNPFVKLLASVIREEMEHACDDWVLQFPFQPQQYAEALLLLERKRSDQTASLVLAAGGSNRRLLLTRIRRMLQLPLPPKKRPARFVAGLVAVFLLSLLVNTKKTAVSVTALSHEGTSKLMATTNGEGRIFTGWKQRENSWNQVFTGNFIPMDEQPVNAQPETQSNTPVISNSDNYVEVADNKQDIGVLSPIDESPEPELIRVHQTEQPVQIQSTNLTFDVETGAYTYKEAPKNIELPAEAATVYMLPYVPRKSFETIPSADTSAPLAATLKSEQEAMEAALQTQLALNKINWQRFQAQLQKAGSHADLSDKDVQLLLEKELAKLNWKQIQLDARQLMNQWMEKQVHQAIQAQKEMEKNYQQTIERLNSMNEEMKKLEKSLQQAEQKKQKAIRQKEAELRKKHKIVHI